MAENNAPRSGQAPRKKAMHKAVHDPRAAALVALAQVVDEGVASQAALDALLVQAGMTPSDRRLCTELLYGTLRRYSRLEWFLRRFLRQPEKLPREMFLALLLAWYSMSFMRIPHHAAVGWAVGHVRNRFGQGLGNVANGTLRAMQRSLKPFYDFAFYREHTTTEQEALALWHSVPQWVVALWHKQYGEEAALALLQASEEAAPSGLRLNKQHAGWAAARQLLLDETEDPVVALDLAGCASSEDIASLAAAAEPQEKAEANNPGAEVRNRTSSKAIYTVGECALAFGGSLPWDGKSLAREGKATRQSAASYLALNALLPHTWPGPVWDACAGRGGKTLALMELGVPVTLAADPSPQRIGALAQEAARLGFGPEVTPLCVVGSAQEVAAGQGQVLASEHNTAPIQSAHLAQHLAGGFGAVLVDAPCSGLGTLSRHPEIRLRRTPEDVQALVATQAAILEAVAPHVAQGGVLAYLTCTMNREENEERVVAFLATHPEFTLEREHTIAPHSPLREFFYGAVLRKC